MLWGKSSYTEGSSMYTEYQSIQYSGRHMGYMITDDLLLSTRVSNVTMELDYCEFDNDSLDNAPNPNMGYRAYEPLPNMTNIDQSIEGGLEFLRLPHKTPGHANTYRDVRVLEVGTEYPNKDVFLVVLKQYSFKNNMNYYVTKSHFEKFEGKCIMKDRRCKWKSWRLVS
ncbi:hypothetical protein J1N35_034235 [Gossypium stocksii]|uniref:Transposase MuDR plant domain-containing protein n=1 Tax=Gossypium stocksii TaxID=47602 RepID=A0A9D3ZQI3_9ROSI|nr:hypothetical protein J1N35_034235 [Gossypium stocksii]